MLAKKKKKKRNSTHPKLVTQFKSLHEPFIYSLLPHLRCYCDRQQINSPFKKRRRRSGRLKKQMQDKLRQIMQWEVSIRMQKSLVKTWSSNAALHQHIGFISFVVEIWEKFTLLIKLIRDWIMLGWIPTCVIHIVLNLYASICKIVRDGISEVTSSK